LTHFSIFLKDYFYSFLTIYTLVYKLHLTDWHTTLNNLNWYFKFFFLGYSLEKGDLKLILIRITPFSRFLFLFQLTKLFIHNFRFHLSFSLCDFFVWCCFISVLCGFVCYPILFLFSIFVRYLLCSDLQIYFDPNLVQIPWF
jgi:hypothetical protein